MAHGTEKEKETFKKCDKCNQLIKPIKYEHKIKWSCDCGVFDKEGKLIYKW
jgi:hypothetical protein